MASVVRDLILDHSKWIVVAATAVYVLVSRSGSSLSFVLGALGSMVVARVLKRAFNQPRPPEGAWKSTEGFPSSHATNLTFYYASIIAVHGPLSTVGLSALLSLIVLLSWRVKHGYHSTDQIAAGVALGFAITYGWKYLEKQFSFPTLIADAVNHIVQMKLLTP